MAKPRQSHVPDATDTTPWVIPPENFVMVDKGVYRSGFPKRRHFPFLEQIGIRTIICLVLEEYPEANLQFLETIGARLLKFGVAGNKEPFVDIPSEIFRAALYAVLDVRNHPVLIHCNKGKHRTGCLVGCYRKVQKWSMTAVFDEYRRLSHPKSRSVDQQFIETFKILPPELEHSDKRQSETRE
uniref:diphosphoinositol-polyphosphate diphosphatase n=1 Tax=Spongospora subterranea TaxID=70186 RepID=A0A0H5RB57_9EUKA|eukprot:CRZ10847.1 hypothetical protein [Spongospora subterranea]